MGNKIKFYAQIRWIITFISEEIEKIPSSQKTKKQILNICDAISTKVLHNIGKTDDEKLMAEMNRQLTKFDLLIKELENDDNEKTAYILLINHVADILALTVAERQKILINL